MKKPTREETILEFCLGKVSKFNYNGNFRGEGNRVYSYKLCIATIYPHSRRIEFYGGRVSNTTTRHQNTLAKAYPELKAAGWTITAEESQ